MSLNITKPDVGGDADAWGSKLNTALDAIVSFVNTLSTSITDGLALKLNKAGDTLTGRLNAKTATVATVGLAGNAPVIDLSLGQFFAHTITQATNFQAFTNKPAAGQGMGFVLRLTNGGAANVTFAETIHWPGGARPPFTAAGTDILVFLSDDAGATWKATVAIKDAR